MARKQSASGGSSDIDPPGRAEASPDGAAPPTVAAALRRACAELANAGLRSPREDSELILAWVLGRDRVFLHAHPEAPLTKSQAADFARWTQRRAEHFPLQYMLGEQEFFGRPFKVDESTLIPRPETEVVVETALELLDRMPPGPRRALDVGTGCGCIAVSLACERPDLKVVAVDISRPALEVARGNAVRLGCADRVEFLQSDVLSAAGLEAEFDLVVSNPPYLAWERRHEADRSVVLYEPPSALFAEGGGLEVYEKLLIQTPRALRPGGRLVVELGYDLLDAVASLAGGLGWRLVSTAGDLAGVVRCAVWERPRRRV